VKGRPPRVPRYVLEANINIGTDLTEINCEGVDWFKVAQDRKL
jgi:hypothetical protein